jgi:hypothetical protein
MKPIVFFLTLFLAISSCRKSENYSNSTQLFRSRFNNTSWSNPSIGNDVVTFMEGKIFYFSVPGTQPYYYTVGTYNNIAHDGCVYPTVKSSIDLEDNDTFVCTQTTTSGAGSACQGNTYTITFQALNDNNIQMILWNGPPADTISLSKTNAVSIQNAVDGIAIGMLWN